MSFYLGFIPRCILNEYIARYEIFVKCDGAKVKRSVNDEVCTIISRLRSSRSNEDLEFYQIGSRWKNIDILNSITITINGRWKVYQVEGGDSRKTRDKTAGRLCARIAVSIRSMHQPSFQNNFKRAYLPVSFPPYAVFFFPIVSRNREYPSRTFADCLLTRRQIAHFIFVHRHGNMHRPIL